MQETTTPFTPEMEAHFRALTKTTIWHSMQAISAVETDKRVSVLVGHGMIELMVNALIKAKLKNGTKISSDSRGYPHSTRLLLLHETGVLDDGEFERLTWYRKLRNRAAHDPIFEVEDTVLKVDKNGTEYRNPLKDELLGLVTDLWNAHITVFAPVFLPTPPAQAFAT